MCSRRTQDRRRLYAAAQLEALHDHKNQRARQYSSRLRRFSGRRARASWDCQRLELLANLNIDFIGSAGDER